MNLGDLIKYSRSKSASDIHISANNPPIFRIHGDMETTDTPKLSSEEVKDMLFSIMTENQRKDYEENMEIDFAISFGEERFRINAFTTLNGPACVFRTIPTKVVTLEELAAPQVITNLCSLSKGLVLVTGPTGSGKSTTVAAMIDHMNRTSQRHILTIEDPVEFVHTSDKSLINQREIGPHSASFARALKSALREDPDVILVGELRDLETIKLAMTAAETGHLVLGSLHTSSAAQTIDRIIDVFPAEDKEMIRTMLSASIEAVISQRLLKLVSGHGRVAAFEILTANSAVRNLIRESKIPQLVSAMQVGTQQGMRVMKDSIYALLNSGQVSAEEAKTALNITDTVSESEIKIQAKTAVKPPTNGGF